MEDNKETMQCTRETLPDAQAPETEVKEAEAPETAEAAAQETQKSEDRMPENQPPDVQVPLIQVPEQMAAKRRKGLWWKISLCVLAALLILAAVAAYVIWDRNEFFLDFTMLGDPEITLEYGETFSDPGAQAQFYGSLLLQEPEEIAVQVTGTVDADVLGTYQLTYTASRTVDYYFGTLEFQKSSQRTVHIIDTVAPEITLITDPESYTLPGQLYVEEGFTATDNYDGQIDHKVVRYLQNGKVHYKVADSSGNLTEVIREILYSDPIAPELTLIGEETVTLQIGQKYQEPGYTALDNFDGDITERVTVSGELDLKKPGTYQLTYTVSDSYQNTASAVRTIVIREYPELPDMPRGEAATPVTPEGKVIYLTFDDGPGEHTGRLLDILDKYDVKATFFVVDKGYYHLLTRMAESGHTVAMHCAKHNYARVYESEEAYFKDLKTIQDIVKKYTGQTSTIVRFPGGSSNTVSRRYSQGIMYRLTRMLTDMGYRYFDWNVDSRDAGGATTSEEVYYNVINGIKNHRVSIVLQHDIKGYSVNAVEKIIQWALKNGYTFKTLDSSSPVCEHRLNN